MLSLASLGGIGRLARTAHIVSRLPGLSTSAPHQDASRGRCPPVYLDYLQPLFEVRCDFTSKRSAYTQVHLFWHRIFNRIFNRHPRQMATANTVFTKQTVTDCQNARRSTVSGPPPTAHWA